MYPWLILFLAILRMCWADNGSLQAIYNSLDPRSVAQLLAFYELYPQTPLGQSALSRAWELLSDSPSSSSIPSPAVDIGAIVNLVNRQSCDPPPQLNEEQLQIIERLSHRLKHHHLKGSEVWDKEELPSLQPEEIDLGRALLLHQFESRSSIRQYEASLDLMALQIAAHLPPHASIKEKVAEINRFIFQEMQFRFPPHSIHAKEIDLYTFLPSVLDSRQGVCLGVSILYLCLAQRLDLPLEIITPPGHIFVRVYDNGKYTNIETTARGIHVPSEAYLGVGTRSLKKRNLKEVVGLSFVNQASVAWGKQEYETTVALYEKAAPYLPDDPLLNTFLGYCYLFIGKEKEGRKLLAKIRNTPFIDAVAAESIADDYLRGRCDAEAIKTIFLFVDETRASILAKQEKLQAALKRYPLFREGLLHLAITHLQLGRMAEGLSTLERYHAIDPSHAVVEYYLATLCFLRLDYNRSWRFLHNAESLTAARDHHPKALQGLRQQLRQRYPEIES